MYVYGCECECESDVMRRCNRMIHEVTFSRNDRQNSLRDGEKGDRSLDDVQMYGETRGARNKQWVRRGNVDLDSVIARKNVSIGL